MKGAIFRTVFCIGVFAAALSNYAQGTIFMDVRTVSSSLSGYHVDQFFVTASKPIATLNSWVSVAPMNQVQPGGSPSVFPVMLSPAEAERDSHFTFDISSARILSQSESSSELRASVAFDANHPTSFMLARAVAPESHAPYEAFVFGTFIDGEEFSRGIVWVPEPSILSLGLLGLIAAAVLRPKARA